MSWKPPPAGAEGFGAGRACKMIRVTAPMVHRAILCRQYVWKPWASRRSSVFCVSFQRKASKSFPRRPPSSTTRGRKLFPSAAQRLEYLPIFSCAALGCRSSSVGCLSHIAGCCRENCSNVQEKPVVFAHYNVRPQVGPRELCDGWRVCGFELAGIGVLRPPRRHAAVWSFHASLDAYRDELVAICVWEGSGALGAFEVAVVVMKFSRRRLESPERQATFGMGHSGGGGW